MAYTLYPSGRTGPSENIGGSSDYHIDSKFSTALGSDEARRRFEAIVRKYKELGRDVEFSNNSVSDEIYDLDADEAVRRDLWDRATAAHAPREGWYSLDYYAPLSGMGRWDKSAEGAPIFGVGGEGSRVETGTGGNYGFYSLIYNKDGDLISKVGHGDDRFPVSPDPSTPSPAADTEVTTPAVAVDYSKMSGSDLNAEYDKLRMAGDVFKAEQEGMKMHKALFGKS